MNKEEKEKLNKKLKLYEHLGAKKFQKVVFLVEKIKFKLINKIPKFISIYEKLVDSKSKKRLKHASTEKEKQTIYEQARIAKLAMRRELRTSQNRNYHINSNNPLEIKTYLEWNKSIHKKGLVKNIIFIPIFSFLLLSNIEIALPLLVFELISTVINFECINIQNYNLCQFQKVEDRLVKREKRRILSNIESHGEASKVISDTMQKKEDKIPTIDDIIGNIKTKEQAEQMKILLDQVKRQRNLNQFTDNQKEESQKGCKIKQ